MGIEGNRDVRVQINMRMAIKRVSVLPNVEVSSKGEPVDLKGVLRNLEIGTNGKPTVKIIVLSFLDGVIVVEDGEGKPEQTGILSIFDM